MGIDSEIEIAMTIGLRHSGSNEGRRSLKVKCRAVTISKPTKMPSSPGLMAGAPLLLVPPAIAFAERQSFPSVLQLVPLPNCWPRAWLSSPTASTSRKARLSASCKALAGIVQGACRHRAGRLHGSCTSRAQASCNSREHDPYASARPRSASHPVARFEAGACSSCAPGPRGSRSRPGSRGWRAG